MLPQEPVELTNFHKPQKTLVLYYAVYIHVDYNTIHCGNSYSILYSAACVNTETLIVYYHVFSVSRLIPYPTLSHLQMDYLFFTDILEANLTLTVDPDSEIPKGLGVVNATTLLRVVCTTNVEPTFKYCSSSAFALYEVDGGGG